MADMWWHAYEETKLLFGLWSEEVVQNDLNTMHNNKLVWAQVSQGMAEGVYTRGAQ